MTSHLLPPVVALLVAALVCFAITPLVRLLAERYAFRDRPHPRRSPHLKLRLGGVALFLGFATAVLVTSPWAEGRTAEESRKVWGILLGGGIVLAMGVWDDRRELPAVGQLVFQLLGSVIAVAAGVIIEQLPNPWGSPLHQSSFVLPLYAAYGFTIFWIIGAINSMDFVDGLDGLATGIGAIAGALLTVHSLRMGQYSIALLPAALTGSALGLLPRNFYPARITLGTSGSAFLGFALATLSVVGGTKAATLLLVLGVPIVDLAWTVLRRMRARRPVYVGDRAHLHFRLLESGLSERRTVLVLYALCALFGSLSLVLASRMLKLYALVGMGILVVGLLAILSQKQAEGAMLIALRARDILRKVSGWRGSK